MTTRGRLIAYVLYALAAAWTTTSLTACSDSQPAAVQPSTHTPTPRPTATTQPTTSSTSSGTDDAAWARVPKEARAHTYAGAQAFAEFYLGETNEAWRLARADILSPFASSSCASCRNLVSNAESLKIAQRHYASDAFQLRAAAWLPESQPDKVQVSILIKVLPAEIVDLTGEVVETVPAETGALRYRVDWQGDQWVITSIKQELAR